MRSRTAIGLGHQLMTIDPLADYAYLWDGSDEGWVVLEDSTGVCVFNELKMLYCLIEDTEEKRAVIEMMRRHDVKTNHEMPQREFDITDVLPPE